MTYVEYLADNQRLRKRIIELEQENARHKLNAKHISTNVKVVPTEIWYHWMMLSSDAICIKEQKKLTL